MSQEEKFFYESLQDSQTVKDFMQSLLDGIQEGRIRLNSNGDEIVLEPSTLFKFTVKARKKGDTTKLSVKISWSDTKKVNVTPDSGLEISS